jgi:hydrogenase maturation protease
MTSARILIAGIGNIFFADDAFGAQVAQRLSCQAVPEGVRVVDFGIRGLDLAYALLDPYEAVIFVDAVPRSRQPGTLYVLELPAPASAATPGDAPSLEAHGMDLGKVLQVAATLGTPVRQCYLVGCEPTPLQAADDMEMGLSGAVAAVIDEAVDLVLSLAEKLLRGEPVSAAAGVDAQPQEGPHDGTRPCTSSPSP